MGLEPGARARDQPPAVGRERQAPDVVALGRIGVHEGVELEMGQPLHVGPFPVAEVRRGTVEDLLGQGGVVVQEFAVGQVHAIDVIAAAERLGPGVRLARHEGGHLALLHGKLALGLGLALGAAQQEDPQRRARRRR